MNRQELIEKYELELKDVQLKFGASFKTKVYEDLIEDLKELDEPQKVTIPQFVADWISFVKTNGLKFKNTYGFYEEIAPSDDVYRVMYYIFKESIADKEIRKWVCDNIDTFARAWLDGYEVEKEKRYLVTLKNGQPLVKSQSGSTLYFSQDITAGNYKVTRKESEQAGFGWVFDCPGVEVEEVN